MVVSRRRILQIAALPVMGFPFLNALSRESSFPSIENLILGGGQYKLLNENKNRYVFSIVDADLSKTSFIELDFLPHGIHMNPKNLNTVAVFEKKGPNACEIDLKKRQVIRKIKTDEKRAFYGHGAYSIDGTKLFSTETYLNSQKGVITIRDSQTMAFMGEFPSYGNNPHECKLIENGRVLVVTNGGGQGKDDVPRVSYIDVNTKKLVRRIELTNTHLNIGHFAVADDGGVVVVSAPRDGLSKHDLGGVSIQSPGEKMQSISNPATVTQRMNGEALSVVIHEEKKIAAVTHPDGGMITFWSMKSRQLLKVVNLPHPRGVTLTQDNSAFLISYDLTPKLIKVNASTLLTDQKSIVSGTYITGSHLYNWSRGLTEIMAPGPLV